MATCTGSEVDYQLTETLGSGVSAVVRKAELCPGPAGQIRGRCVPVVLVVKCFNAHVRPSEVCYEAELLSRLKFIPAYCVTHSNRCRGESNIVQLFSGYREGNLLRLILEFVPQTPFKVNHRIDN